MLVTKRFYTLSKIKNNIVICTNFNLSSANAMNLGMAKSLHQMIQGKAINNNSIRKREFDIAQMTKNFVMDGLETFWEKKKMLPAFPIFPRMFSKRFLCNAIEKHTTSM